MKLTRKDVIEAMGLKIGDKIIVKDWRKIYTINDEYCLMSNDRCTYGCTYSPNILMDAEFEIVPPTKKVGEQLCNNTDCDSDTCPLHSINCSLESKDNPSLYDVLEAWHKKYKDDEIYDILKARLDKEVE